MKIRLGYVSLSKAFDAPFKTKTYTQFEKEEDASQKLDIIIRNNLESLLQILQYNQKNHIHFYRITSNLIPLATHDNVSFEYIKTYQEEYKKIGDFIKCHQMRCDMHPDQFAVLNSTKKEVVENTKKILRYHGDILKAMHIPNPRLILHVGSNVFGKKNALTRFKNTFHGLPLDIKKMIVVENDDKVFSVKDVLSLCESLKIPMVLDYHHYLCNKDDVEIQNVYKQIFDTWKNQNPKVHFSSPKNKTKKEFRSHSDYIDSASFIAFVESIKTLPYDIDVMIEAKQKDDAIFRLMRELKYKTNYTFIDETTFCPYN